VRNNHTKSKHKEPSAERLQPKQRLRIEDGGSKIANRAEERFDLSHRFDHEGGYEERE
jgi:hypothetical protein